VLVNVLLTTKGTSYGTPADTVSQSQAAFYAALAAANIPFDRNGAPISGLVNSVPIVLKDRKLVGKLRRVPGVAEVVPVVQVKLEKAKTRMPKVDEGAPVAPEALGKRNIDPRAFALLQPHALTGVRATHARGITGQTAKIGMIDTGITADHPAFGNCFGQPTCVLQSFTDYADPTNTTPIDCSLEGHGTRVAGIMVGRAQLASSPPPPPSSSPARPTSPPLTFTGVAPDAQLHVYRTYVCGQSPYGESTWFVRALEKAVMQDKVDVINISLGEVNPWAVGTLGKAIEAVLETRPNVVIVGTAGNGGNSPYQLFGPGSTTPVLSVGSIDNRFVLARTMEIVRQQGGASVDVDYLYSISDPIVPGDISDEIVVLRGGLDKATQQQCDDNEYVTKMVGDNAVVANKTVVLYTGACNIVRSAGVLADSAVNAGARSVLLALANNDLSSPAPPTGARAAAPPKFVVVKDRKVTLSTEDHIVHNTNSGQLSAFTSFGPTATFDLKPEIVAYGGSVLSAQPAEYGGLWGLNDGTSFSAPYVSGCIALLRQALGPNPSAQDLRAILMQSAVPAYERDPDIPGLQALPVQGQGAGVVNMLRALELGARVGPLSSLSLKPPGATGNGTVVSKLPVTIQQGKDGRLDVDARGRQTYTRKITVTNNLSTPARLRLQHIAALSLVADPKTNVISDTMAIAPSTVSFRALTPGTSHSTTAGSTAVLTLRARATAEVEVQVTPDNGRTRNSGALFSGYLRVTSTTNGSARIRTLHVPYAGYNGDLSLTPMYPRDKSRALALAFADTSTTPETVRPLTGWTKDTVIPWTQYDNPSVYLSVAFQTTRPSRQLIVGVF
ncbi:peptidase S8/S53 domain-containing protein, partial [Catenaria anguillulae PL171]